MALAVVSVATLAVARVWDSRIASGYGPRDALPYYAGALLVAEGRGDQLYTPNAMREAQLALLADLPAQQSRDVLLLLNPPFVAALFLPLALLPVGQAYLVWGVVNTFLAVALAILCWAAASARTPWQTGLWIVASLTFVPLYAALLLGQVSLVLALAVLAGWTLVRRERPIMGGLALSALLIKPQYAAPVLVALVVMRHWPAVAGFGLGTAVACLLSFLAVGWQGALSYLRLMSQVANLWPDYGWNPAADYTWRGFTLQVLGQGMHADLVWAGLSAITLALMAKPWRVSRPSSGPYGLVPPPDDARFAGFLLGGVLISPHTLDYDLVLLLPAALLGWRGLRRSPGREWLVPLWLIIGALVSIAFWWFLAMGRWPAVQPQVVPLMAAGLVLLAAAGGWPRGGGQSKRPANHAPPVSPSGCNMPTLMRASDLHLAASVGALLLPRCGIDSDDPFRPQSTGGVCLRRRWRVTSTCCCEGIA